MIRPTHLDRTDADASDPRNPENQTMWYEHDNEEYRCQGCCDCQRMMKNAGDICTECQLYIAEYA